MFNTSVHTRTLFMLHHVSVPLKQSAFVHLTTSLNNTRVSSSNPTAKVRSVTSLDTSHGM